VFYRQINKWVCGLCILLILAGCSGGSGSSDGADGSPATVANPVTQGVAVDPYIVGAVFQEVAEDGTTILQRQSTPTDANGLFTFPNPLATGSTVEMKVSNRGVHAGAPFQGVLRRVVLNSDHGSVTVSPLTTLLAGGVTPEDAIAALNNAGFSGLTTPDLYRDPMKGLNDLTSGVTDQRLRLLQASMAVEAYMEITGNFHPTLSDLTSASQQGQILNSMAGTMRGLLNANEFTKVGTDLAGDPQVTGPLVLGDLIKAVVQQQQTTVALVKVDMLDQGTFDPALVAQEVTNGMGQMAPLVKNQYMARQPQTIPANGAIIYANNCATCHGALADSSKKGRSAIQIKDAIADIGSMGFLGTLTAGEIQAVADALAGITTPPPGTTPDGVTLYSNNCADCHGALATTSKSGRTASDIQNAITNDTGGMSFLSTLTAGEIQAIANVLPVVPPPNPGTPPDGVALYNSECSGCHGPLATTAKPGRTATQIRAAISNNTGGMGFLSTLTATEIQSIANALPSVTPPTTGTSPDGVSLYTSECSGCHGPLATTAKSGRTATQIQAAISNNTGGMGFLSTLTASEIQAIVRVLPASSPGGGDYSNCTSCHGQPPSGNSYPNVAGAHAVHTALPSVNNNCGVCHVGAAHNGQVDLGIVATYNAKSGTATPNNNTCSNVSCHGGQTTPAWQTGTIAVDTQCTSCHTSGTGQYNSYYSGQHARHISKGYSCTVCHNTAKLSTGHFINLATTTFEQDPATTIGGGSTSVGSYTPSASRAVSGTCSSVKCHGSRSW
jgi:predicted CxxxxCH...CXXCH cytochrome family protein